MATFTSGKDVADYIYGEIIPEIRACATDVKVNQKKHGRDALEAQIDCVLRKFGKTVTTYRRGRE